MRRASGAAATGLSILFRKQVFARSGELSEPRLDRLHQRRKAASYSEKRQAKPAKVRMPRFAWTSSGEFRKAATVGISGPERTLAKKQSRPAAFTFSTASSKPACRPGRTTTGLARSALNPNTSRTAVASFSMTSSKACRLALGERAASPQPDRRHPVCRMIPPHADAKVDACEFVRDIDVVAVQQRNPLHPGAAPGHVVANRRAPQGRCGIDAFQTAAAHVGAAANLPHQQFMPLGEGLLQRFHDRAERAGPGSSALPWLTDNVREFGRQAKKTGIPIVSSAVRSPTRVMPSACKCG